MGMAMSGENKDDNMSETKGDAEIKLHEIAGEMSDRLSEGFDTKKAEAEIVRKFKIKALKGGIWEPNDIRTVWKKIERMRKRDSRRIPWTLVTLSKCRKWEMKIDKDNHNREKDVMESKLRGLQDRCDDLKSQFENCNKEKEVMSVEITTLQDRCKELENQLEQVKREKEKQTSYSVRERKILKSCDTDYDTDTDSDEFQGAKARLRPLRVDVKKGKKKTEVYLQKTKEGNVLMDREIQGHDEVHYKYLPANSKDLFKWSKEVGDVRKDPRAALARLEALKEVFSLSFRDGFSIVSVNLSAADRRNLKEALGDVLCDESMADPRSEIEGWKRLKMWCRKAQQQKVDWNEISRCKQKANESVEDYTERMCETFSMFSGLDQKGDPVSFIKVPGKGGPFLSVWLDGLLPEIKKGICNRKEGLGTPTDSNFTVDDLMKTANDVARAESQASKSMRSLNADSDNGSRNTVPWNVCLHCGKKGHRAKHCYLRKKHNPKAGRVGSFPPPPPLNVSDPVHRFAQLPSETQQRLLGAVQQPAAEVQGN